MRISILASKTGGMIVGAVLAATVLGGCVQTVKENRLRTKLMEAGVPERQATCMADRMAERLSVAQLRRLQDLAGNMDSIQDFVSAVMRSGDGEVVGVTLSAAGRCGIEAARF